MSNPFLGSITLFAGNFAPRGYMFCQGQLLAISQNSALFALLGTIYGGDGQTTFALPNLAGRAAVHQGQGPGLSNYVIGQSTGVENVTLTSNQLPSHSHIVNASIAATIGAGPAGAVWAQPSSGLPYAAAPNVAMNPAALTSSGGNQPHENMMPFLVLNFIIAVEGIFPSRN
jgi:microcystin-dependent protein